MWTYEKRLQFPVKITQTCPKTASLIISQFGGPDGELAASMRYLSQRYTMPCKEVGGLLTDIGTEELAHLEMICATYPSHFHTFEMDGFTVRIENSLLAEALENLDGKKRDVILRYYFLGFDDTEISKILEVNRSTIQRRRHAGLEFIKKFMEEEA